jgi:hypothetical protein
MRRLFVIVVMALTGCDDPFQPFAGTYSFADAASDGAECRLLTLNQINQQVFFLTYDDAGITAAVGADGALVFDCTLSGRDLECLPFERVYDYTPERDAIVTVTWHFGARFADQSTVESGEFGLTQACVGAACDAVAEEAGAVTPCRSEFTFTAAQ